MKRSKMFFSFLLAFLSVVVLFGCNNTETTTTTTETSSTAPVSFSISLNSQTKTVEQGDSFILVVTLNGITEYDSIGWAVDGDLVQVAPNGLNAVITAGTETGEDTITVTVTKGDVDQTASCVVTINPISVDLSVDSENITLNQGESVDLSVTIDPTRDEMVVAWSQTGSLLTIDSDGNDATLTAGSATGTTTVVITATVYGEPFTKEITVTVNEIVPYVTIDSASVDINAGDEIELNLDFLPAYQSDKTWSVAFSSPGFATAEVNAEDKLIITALEEGQVTLTLTMSSNSVNYTDTLVVNIRPLGFVSVANNV